MNLTKQLFQEEFKRLPQEQFLHGDIKARIRNLEHELQAKIAAFEQALDQIAERFFQSLAANELSVDDFWYKSKGPGGFFIKLKNGNIIHWSISGCRRELMIRKHGLLSQAHGGKQLFASQPRVFR